MKRSNIKKTFKKGFTLVELSIVLVIIGLLIGGILVAQSMIESTKIQSFARQVGQFDAAVGTFIDKFNDLPGDNSLFGATESSNTLGDGTIEGLDGAILEFDGEIGSFWNDLSEAGLTSESGTVYTDRDTNAATALTLGTVIPKASAGSDAGVIAFGVSGNNFYWISGVGSDESLSSLPDAFVPADALAIDTKLDDGDGDAGDVIGDSDAALDGALTPTTTDTTCIDANGVYAVATTTATCQTRIRVGTTTGYLQ